MSGSFVFERDDKNVGQMVFCDFDFTAAWFDPYSGTLYCAAGENGDIYEWDKLDQPRYTVEWKSKVIKTKDYINLGAARVIADYAGVAGEGTSTWDAAAETWDGTDLTWSGLDNVTFKLWADKQLIFSAVLSDDKIFRLPTGYRSDTFEFSVTGNVRIRAVHLAETPLGLKEA